MLNKQLPLTESILALLELGEVGAKLGGNGK